VFKIPPSGMNYAEEQIWCAPEDEPITVEIF
jgi:hypothetical protein